MQYTVLFIFTNLIIKQTVHTFIHVHCFCVDEAFKEVWYISSLGGVYKEGVVFVCVGGVYKRRRT